MSYRKMGKCMRKRGSKFTNDIMKEDVQVIKGEVSVRQVVEAFSVPFS
jgi:hypothetical protein